MHTRHSPSLAHQKLLALTLCFLLVTATFTPAVGLASAGTFTAGNDTGAGNTVLTAGNAPVVNTDTGEGFDSVQAAVDATNTTTGHTIVIGNGTYGPVIIDKSVSLVGENGSASTVVEGTASGAAIRIAASSVTVDGLSVSNPNGTTGIASASQPTDDLAILNTTVSEVGTQYTGTNDTVNSRDGIYLVNADQVQVTNVTVRNVLSGGESASQGIHLDDGGGGTDVAPTDVTITESLVTDLFSEKAAIGIHLNARVERITISESVIRDVQAVKSTTSPYAYAGGIQLSSAPSDVTIRNNTIDQIRTDLSAPNSYEGTGLILESGAKVATLDIQYNRFSATDFAFQNKNATTALAENNWWNSSAGPNATTNDYRPAEQGEIIDLRLGPTDFTPWLDAPNGSSFTPSPTENVSSVLELTSRADPLNNDTTYTYNVTGTVTNASQNGVTQVTVTVDNTTTVTGNVVVNTTSGLGQFEVPVTLSPSPHTLVVSAGAIPDDANSMSTATLRLDGDLLPGPVEMSVTQTDPLNADSDSGLTAVDEASNDVVDGVEDFDNDSLLAYYEVIYGTDLTTNDTDADSVPDVVEVQFGPFNPTAPDTDGDGTLDGAEDTDGDGLDTLEELGEGTSPVQDDTDRDGLTDDVEVSTNATSAIIPDTDGDGLLDGVETELGSDPSIADTDDDGTLDANETYRSTASDTTTGTSVSITGVGNAAADVRITESPDAQLNASSVSALNGEAPVTVTAGEFQHAELTLPYDSSEVGNENNVAIFRYNETLQTFVEVPSVVDTAANTVTANVTEFSTFAALESAAYVDSVQRQTDFSPTPVGTNNPTEASDWDVPLYVDRFDNNNLAGWSASGGSTDPQSGGFFDPVNDNGRVTAVNEQLEVFSYGCFITRANRQLPAYNGTIRIAFDWTRQQDDGVHTTEFYLYDDGVRTDYTVVSGDDLPQPSSSASQGSVVIEADVNGTVTLQYEVRNRPGISSNNECDYGAADGTTLRVDNIDTNLRIENATDSDGDGLPNLLEELGYATGLNRTVTTDPLNPDTDGDGLSDGEEVGSLVEVLSLTPYTVNSDPTTADTDGDGVSDFTETRRSYQVVTTNTRRATLSFIASLDNSSVSPIETMSVRNTTSSPLRADSDGDGLSDDRERDLSTDARATDSDSDGATDDDETARGADPTLFDIIPPETAVLNRC